MSLLFADLTVWVPPAVLVASLAGSAHCVSMCGGLVVATATRPRAWVAYQAGRLLGYLALGAGAGLIGQRILEANFATRWVSAAVGALLGIGFVLAGARVWRGKAPHFSILPASWLAVLYRLARGSALGTGLLSAFLPCGWLHAFVLGAVATRSIALGAGFLLMFWLGTLPALMATPWLTQRVLGPLATRAPRLAASLLILAGALCVGAKLGPMLPAESRADTDPPALLQCHPGD